VHTARADELTDYVKKKCLHGLAWLDTSVQRMCARCVRNRLLNGHATKGLIFNRHTSDQSLYPRSAHEMRPSMVAVHGPLSVDITALSYVPLS